MSDLQFEFVFDVRPWSSVAQFDGIREALDAVDNLLRLAVRVSISDADIRIPEISIDGINFGSPLRIAGTINHLTDLSLKSVTDLLNAMLNRVLYYDLERERREIADQSALQDVHSKDIDNARQMLDLLREAGEKFGLHDIAILATSLDSLTSRVVEIRHHRIGPVTRGAAAEVEKDENR